MGAALAKTVIQAYAPFKHTWRDEWLRLFETWSAFVFAAAAGPVFPLEWILKRGLSRAERIGRGFFVPAPYVTARYGERLLAEIPAAVINNRLTDWVQWGGLRLHTGTRFLGAGDWSGISNPVMDSPVAREAKELFDHGLDYRETRAFRRYLERAQKGNPLRRNRIVLADRNLVVDYFERFVALFRSIQENGVLRREALGRGAGFSRRSHIRRLRTELGEKEIGIAVGREGEVYRLPGGQHRTAIAMVLGTENLPVQVRLVHAEWVRQRMQAYGGTITGAILRGIKDGVNTGIGKKCG